jgi:hypothetical protein
MNYRNLEIPAVGLAACIVGLIVSPYTYIAIGALFQFSLAFSLVTLPPLLFSSGFLLWRFLAKPKQGAMSIPMLGFELISWIVIITFLILISRFNLFTVFERAGLFCTFFLSASVLCFPLVSLRDAALNHRLIKLPRGITIAVLTIVLILSVLIAIIYQISSPRLL